MEGWEGYNLSDLASTMYVCMYVYIYIFTYTIYTVYTGWS